MKAVKEKAMGGAGYGNHGDDAKVPDPAVGNESAGKERPGSGPGGKGTGAGCDLPSAGPHADASLTNPAATPGVGTLPDVEGGDVDPGAG